MKILLKRKSLYLCLITMVAFTFSFSSNSYARSFSVKYHINSSEISNGGADSTLRSATSKLKNRNSWYDVACDVTLRRSGSVQPFYATDGTISSQNEFYQAINASGNIKMVNRINWCGGFGSNIVGCAPIGGSSFVATRQNSTLWAHEHGHNRGLRHRSNTSRAIMYPSLQGGNEVNNSECRSFR